MNCGKGQGWRPPTVMMVKLRIWRVMSLEGRGVVMVLQEHRVETPPHPLATPVVMNRRKPSNPSRVMMGMMVMRVMRAGTGR